MANKQLIQFKPTSTTHSTSGHWRSPCLTINQHFDIVRVGQVAGVKEWRVAGVSAGQADGAFAAWVEQGGKHGHTIYALQPAPQALHDLGEGRGEEGGRKGGGIRSSSSATPTNSTFYSPVKERCLMG